MGVKSKLYRFAQESTDCCQIETRSMLSTRGRPRRAEALGSLEALFEDLERSDDGAIVLPSPRYPWAIYR